jgi:hypothetical protein
VGVLLLAASGCAPKKWSLLAPSDPAEAMRHPDALYIFSVIHEFENEEACEAARQQLVRKVEERVAEMRAQGRVPDQADIMTLQAALARCAPAAEPTPSR